LTNVKINVCGFDYGEGLPETKNKFDLPFIFSSGNFKMDKKKLSKLSNNKIFLVDIKETFEKFAKTNPPIISAIFFDLDYYSSTINFLNQIPRNQNLFMPRVYCYFDDIFNTCHHIKEHNGELLAINEFNNNNNYHKIGKSLINVIDFKVPLGKNKLFMLQNFTHKDYFKKIVYLKDNLDIGNYFLTESMFDLK